MYIIKANSSSLLGLSQQTVLVICKSTERQKMSEISIVLQIYQVHGLLIRHSYYSILHVFLHRRKPAGANPGTPLYRSSRSVLNMT